MQPRFPRAGIRLTIFWRITDLRCLSVHLLAEGYRYNSGRRTASRTLSLADGGASPAALPFAVASARQFADVASAVSPCFAVSKYKKRPPPGYSGEGPEVGVINASPPAGGSAAPQTTPNRHPVVATPFGGASHRSDGLRACGRHRPT